MVSTGSELIRYNPSTTSIESSKSKGFSWSHLCNCSNMGKVYALTFHKGEIILSSEQGVYSSKSGMSWFTRNSTERSFVDLQDMGDELIAFSSNGHIYSSRSGGFSWYLKK